MKRFRLFSYFGLKLLSVLILILAIIHTYIGGKQLFLNTYIWWQNIIISIQIFIELAVFIQASSMIWGVSNIRTKQKYDGDELTEDFPDIDVYVPTRRVNPQVLAETIEAIRKQDYPDERLHIYIADDTPEEELSQKYDSIAETYNAKYVYEPKNKAYKAGMLNLALPKGNSPYISFFDYDQKPLPGILRHFVGILEDNDKVAFVQAKKSFKDLYNLARVWSAMLYVQFFEVIERVKAENETVMFAGSTACFRRDAINLIGGIPESTFTEDNAMTIELLLQGRHGIFTNRYGSLGTVPYGFQNQIAQLWRWSHGATHVLKRRFTDIVKSPHMTKGQKIDMIGTLGVTPVIVGVYVYAITFLPLIFTGVDSPRLLIYGISSLAFVPIAPALTYFILGSAGLYFAKQREGSEFKFSHMPGFLLIALASNILILHSGATGLLGIWGPKSEKGQWTRDVKILPISLIAFIVGIVLEYYALNWLLAGFSSAIILVLMGITLLPTLPVVLYYNRSSKY